MSVAAETLIEISEREDGLVSSLIPVGTFAAVLHQTPNKPFYVRSYDTSSDEEIYCRVHGAAQTGVPTELVLVSGRGWCAVRCDVLSRVWVVGRDWTHADDLRRGDTLITTYGVDTVDRADVHGSADRVYTLSVPATQCFFANDVLVRDEFN